ncbi:MAG: helix-turn-helix domain-containing protein [Actinomycetes bacterium]
MDTQTALTEPCLLLTPEQAAETLGLGRSRVGELMRARQIRSIKIGRSRRIPYSGLLDFVATSRNGPAPNPPDEPRATAGDHAGREPGRSPPRAAAPGCCDGQQSPVEDHPEGRQAAGLATAAHPE